MNTERTCLTCRYGDNGDNPDGCSSTCFEPDLPDYDPQPVEACSSDNVERSLKIKRPKGTETDLTFREIRLRADIVTLLWALLTGFYELCIIIGMPLGFPPFLWALLWTPILCLSLKVLVDFLVDPYLTGLGSI